MPRSSQSVMRDSVSVPISSTLSAPMAISPWAVDEPVHESRAGGVDVEGATTQSELVLHGGGVAPLPVGRRGGEHDGVDLRRVEARHLERRPPDSIDRPTVRAADPALADAGAGDDPLVARVHRLGKLVIREHLVGERGTPSRDDATSRPWSDRWHVRSPLLVNPVSSSATKRSADGA